MYVQEEKISSFALWKDHPTLVPENASNGHFNRNCQYFSELCVMKDCVYHLGGNKEK